MVRKNLSAPIPGQSLTEPPKKYPWERPPEITDPKEALKLHVDHITRPDVMDGVLALVEAGADIKRLTLGIMRGAVSQGYHSPDISLMVAPVVHEYIKNTADQLGIEYDEGLVDKKEQEAAEKTKAAISAKSKLDKLGLKQLEEERRPKEPPKGEPSMKQETPKRGLMARRK